MTDPPPFPNAELLVIADLEAQHPSWHVGGVTPDDLATKLPFVALRRAGGPSDHVNDYPIVQVEVFAATISQASDVAEAIRERLLAGSFRNSHGQADRAVCTSGHVEVPYADASLRRLVTTYRLTCRRLPS